MKKRLLSALLALCMMFSLFPVSAVASADFTRGGVDNADLPAPQADLSTENGEDSSDNVTRFYVTNDASFQDAIKTISSTSYNAQNLHYEIVLQADVGIAEDDSLWGHINMPYDSSNSLTICSDNGGHYTITCYQTHYYGNRGYELINAYSASLTLRDITIKIDATNFGHYGIIGGAGNITVENCTLDGDNTDACIGIRYPDSGRQEGSTAQITLINSTIKNCSYSGVDLNGGTLNMYSGSVIKDCSRTSGGNGGGVSLNGSETSTLNMKSGSSITGCTARNGGGVYVDSGCTLNMESGSKVYNNTATDTGSDIYLYANYWYNDGSTATLVNAASMSATDASGHAIDGWYPDDTNNRRNRYDATKHVDPVDVSGTLTTDKTTGGIGLVASHAVYDIAFDYANTDNETDTCSAYSDKDCTKKITVAAPGDKVYLKYDENGSLRDGLAADQCISWEGVTGDGTEEGSTKVRVIGADPDAYFTMPKEPAGNKVTLTPTVMNTADVDDGSEPEVPGSDGGSSDGGAGAIVAGTLIGGTAYLLTTRVWLEGLYGYLPANRIELALGLWKRADCPAPASTELYPDIDEDDTDAQAAARWCVEQGLLKDYHQQNEDGTETVTFKPLRYVARPYALNRWYKLEKLLSEQQAAQAETTAEATETPAETDASAEA